MAGIDHTIIAFHNGKLMRNEVKVEGDQYTSLIPFQYTRDGELYGVVFVKRKCEQKGPKKVSTFSTRFHVVSNVFPKYQMLTF